MTTYTYLNNKKEIANENRPHSCGQLSDATIGHCIHSVSINNNVDFFETFCEVRFDGKLIKIYKWSNKTGRPVLKSKTL